MERSNSKLKTQNLELPKVWSCPTCKTPLQQEGGLLICPADNSQYPLRDGTWRLLTNERAAELQPFIEGYQQQRIVEGWGTPEPEYYLNLPYKDTSGRHESLWRLRAVHMDKLLTVLGSVEGAIILDAGAGNCWLSYRLTLKGARMVAIDLNDGAIDGLGAAEVYRSHAGVEVATSQAELESLPIANSQFQAVIINASLHYTPNPNIALKEAYRVLKPGGTLVVMDSSTYHNQEAGKEMVSEWIEHYQAANGKPPAPLPGKGYLTYKEVKTGLLEAGFTPQQIELLPEHTGIRAAIRQIKLKVAPTGAARHRELATHPMWVAKK